MIIDVHGTFPDRLFYSLTLMRNFNSTLATQLFDRVALWWAVPTRVSSGPEP
ncbi:hypothetical protein Btus_2713 [Kyrpidia tusciae DSM 2912]|uniref:Uncharacterized protein n=1 Tax=Kyrpidia tusciae (strain DSM 2912 / NBRC 15312 / T2) TaxID=562970 RepID=D5WUB0_KYRT2|nr:hypothetical protein Btus_2713 [Kyrpidia tusciae DSM 2912]